MLKFSEMHIGAEVYWTDPAEENGDEHSSGYYTIHDIYSNEEHTDEDDDIVVFLRNEAGSELEAYNSELS